MISGRSVLAVIPARGGSKRAPRKNITPFRDKLLILWTVEAAQRSHYIDTVLLSTDDDEIACAAAEHVRVVKRPPELATDDAMNESVLRHCLMHYPYEWVVLLQPTSPLRTAEDIDTCMEIAAFHEDAVCTLRPDDMKNGAVYVAPSKWLETNDFGKTARFHRMPFGRSLDIDYPEDFHA